MATMLVTDLGAGMSPGSSAGVATKGLCLPAEAELFEARARLAAQIVAGFGDSAVLTSPASAAAFCTAAATAGTTRASNIEGTM